ncbi:MAG TPA: phenylacetate-CoA oxygenase subunit PaaC [Saprospiraceae bacterium]|nr:phenylacetate-CoA oxygenase subunit PaaC [Saprospiraceae bacterium]
MIIKAAPHLIRYILQWADNSMILGQRLGEWCGHGPVLEQDIAITNIALDLIGEARNLYQYAARLEINKSEDDYPFLRKEREFLNVQLVELPNRDFAYTISRQFLYDVFHFHFLQQMMESNDKDLAAIAAKSIKEVQYHLDYSTDWLIRLGDGTVESHHKMQKALNDHYPWSDEFFIATNADLWATENIGGPDLTNLKTEVNNYRTMIINKATLQLPEMNYTHRGGKEGIHTEHMGFILADLQYMQRTYPGVQW